MLPDTILRGEISGMNLGKKKVAIEMPYGFWVNWQPRLTDGNFLIHSFHVWSVSPFASLEIEVLHQEMSLSCLQFDLLKFVKRCCG
jgi:hypothetical protein